MCVAADGKVPKVHVDGTCDTAIAFVRSASIVSSGLTLTSERVRVGTREVLSMAGLCSAAARVHTCVQLQNSGSQ